MIYTTEIIVNITLKEFIKKLDNADNMKHWQKDLTSFEHISGVPGTVGSKMKLNYTVNKRKIELIETITHINLPHEIYMSYETKGMHNTQKNHFYTTPEGYTKWVIENEFSPTNLFYKIMVLLMPKAFKKQSEKYLLDFKNFAENGTSIQNA
ncbi:SRPBCC family protein [Lacinutrix sp. C3R15]|uniref:SRPBCC family protein n=1 Tax=Flavobacteriaceae TaxID=49546 RepID=UPI001C0A1847|nr:MULTISPECIES: SRPBCC family protein [Flavobacteriaceae]MBU2938405.1 SRPBCC family protein [Lacinutrix sp. C3R15]MDO6621719.1 SRPBCC family protein [Oceanihabitans sp. 1_MG-2023]